MVEVDNRARSRAGWKEYPGAEARIWEVRGRALRGWRWGTNSHVAVIESLVLSLVYGLQKCLHDDLELLYISSLMSFRMRQNPSVRN